VNGDGKLDWSEFSGVANEPHRTEFLPALEQIYGN